MTTLYLQPRTGFCSRLLVLNEAYQVAKETKSKLVIIWKQTSDCNLDYYDTFSKTQFSDIDCKIVQTYELKDFGKRILSREVFKTIIEIPAWIFSTITIRRYRKKKEQFFPYDKRDRNCQAEDYHRIIEALKAGNSVYCMAYEGLSGYQAEGFYDLSAISFSDKVVSEAKAIVGNEPYVSVHIRRTDHWVAIENSHTEDFELKMDNEIANNPNVRFFLATDDYEEENRIISRYGDRIVVQKNKDLSRASKKGMHDSIIDLLCLANGQKVIGSQRSIFSKVSAELNNIPLDIANM